MRPITPTLRSAQQAESRVPYPEVTLRRKRPRWQEVYCGSEAPYYSAAALTGSDAIIRARLTPPAEGGRLYRQRVGTPDAAADFSQWTDAGISDAVQLALAACGNEVSLCWAGNDRSIYRSLSADDGLNWSAPELVDYAPTSAAAGLAAVYRTDGDLLLFFADQAQLYVRRRSNGVWQPRQVWNKTTGELTGLSGAYDDACRLVLSGRDIAGGWRLWSLSFNDDQTWGELAEMAAAPEGEGYEFRRAALDCGEAGCRCAYVENYSGAEPYDRLYLASTAPGTDFTDGLWTEPEPLVMDTAHGVSILSGSGLLWLVSADRVWLAETDSRETNLTLDITAAILDLQLFRGQLRLEINQADGAGDVAAYGPGDEIRFSPGYVTAAGIEVSRGLSFIISGFSQHTAPGQALAVIEAEDGWARLRAWRARSQLRWNSTHSIKEIIARLLGLAGLRLDVISASAEVNTGYPDFTVSPGGDGLSALKRLLSEVPDRLLLEGDAALLVNPQPDDPAAYEYGSDHAVFSRRLEPQSAVGEIETPPNCAQRLYDVVSLDGLKAMVTGIRLDYRAEKGRYLMRLNLT